VKWVTRAHVHVDRVACPWLIGRFVDSEAEFLFVAPEQVAHQFPLYDALYAWCKLQVAAEAQG
jgi:hypothetical protein